MGNSFKMQKGGANKDQAVQVGVLITLLGLVGGFLVHPIGFGLAIVGLIVAVGGKFASE